MKKITLFVACFIQLVTCSVNAAEIASYQDWHVQTGPNFVEAYTSPNANASFGLYCSGDQCMFYLHDALICQPGGISPVLMSSVNSAASLSIQCTQVGGAVFQILDPFVNVFNTIRNGGGVSFATPLQNGTFAINVFSLQGSGEAIKRALVEAAQSKQKNLPQTQPPSNQPIPGSKRLQDIVI
jgi:hypothetical protein